MIKEYALYTFKDAENCDLVCETQHDSAIQNLQYRTLYIIKLGLILQVALSLYELKI